MIVSNASSLIVHSLLGSHFLICSSDGANPVRHWRINMSFMTGSCRCKSRPRPPISTTTPHSQLELEADLGLERQHVIHFRGAHSRTTAGGPFLDHRECIVTCSPLKYCKSPFRVLTNLSWIPWTSGLFTTAAGHSEFTRLGSFFRWWKSDSMVYIQLFSTPGPSQQGRIAFCRY